MGKGIKLRSGKILLLPRESYYDDSDSSEEEYLITTYYNDLPKEEYLMTSYYKEVDDLPKETVIESIEKKVSSEIRVPNGFGEVAGDYLEKLNGCYQDCRISHDQLNELVKKFAKHLSWFPDDVPQEKIKKFCREAYAHTLWKTFLDEKISRRQFVSLMGRRPKFFPKK